MFNIKMRHGIVLFGILVSSWAGVRTYATFEDFRCDSLRAENKAYLNKVAVNAMQVCGSDEACLEKVDTLILPETLTILELEESKFGCE